MWIILKFWLATSCVCIIQRVKDSNRQQLFPPNTWWACYPKPPATGFNVWICCSRHAQVCGSHNVCLLQWKWQCITSTTFSPVFPKEKKLRTYMGWTKEQNHPHFLKFMFNFHRNYDYLKINVCGVVCKCSWCCNFNPARAANNDYFHCRLIFLCTCADRTCSLLWLLRFSSQHLIFIFISYLLHIYHILNFSYFISTSLCLLCVRATVTPKFPRGLIKYF